VARISDLRRLFEEDQRMREDFISTLTGFFERHHIEVSPEDLKGADDVVGYLFSVGFLEPTRPQDHPRAVYDRPAEA
jgi:hypothetical protein